VVEEVQVKDFAEFRERVNCAPERLPNLAGLALLTLGWHLSTLFLQLCLGVSSVQSEE
jgi:hypothetical protein